MLTKLLPLLLAAFVLTGFQADAAKPNFVFFLVDDFSEGALSSAGSKLHETPHLDKLASQSMRFTHGSSACTVCSPSRAAILNGRYPGRTNCTDWIAGHGRKNPKLLVPKWNMKMDHDQVTLPEALKEAGYATSFIGKWHLMPLREPAIKDKHFPTDHGFDENIGGREWGQPKGKGKFFHPFDMPNVTSEEGDFLTDRLTDYAVDFIDRSKDKPFLLYFSYYTVHGPIMCPPKLKKKYEDKLKTGEFRHTNAAYAGMIESLDDSVGRVLAQLDKHGIANNTVVVFTADNGAVGNQYTMDLRGAKALSYDGGTREPFFVKWPGVVKPGTVSEVPAIGMDFYPTFLDIAGLPLKPDQHMDGVSLVPVLKGGALKKRSLFWHYPHYHKTPPYGAVRNGDWKLIEFFEDGKLELYNLKDDPAEATDLSGKHPEKAQELLKEMRDWRKDVDAQMMERNPDYDPNYKPPPRKKRKKK
jgi:arylsulfatase A-like enzyme